MVSPQRNITKNKYEYLTLKPASNNKLRYHSFFKDVLDFIREQFYSKKLLSVETRMSKLSKSEKRHCITGQNSLNKFKFIYFINNISN